LQQQLNDGTWKVGSPDYEAKQRELAQLKGQFTAQADLMQKQFKDERAKIFFTAYKQITSAVNKFAREHSIDLVLRFNKIEAIDKENPDPNLVEKWIGDPVIFQNNIDITQQVLGMLQNANNVGGNPPPPRR